MPSFPCLITYSIRLYCINVHVVGRTNNLDERLTRQLKERHNSQNKPVTLEFVIPNHGPHGTGMMEKEQSMFLSGMELSGAFDTTAALSELNFDSPFESVTSSAAASLLPTPPSHSLDHTSSSSSAALSAAIAALATPPNTAGSALLSPMTLIGDSPPYVPEKSASMVGSHHQSSSISSSLSSSPGPPQHYQLPQQSSSDSGWLTPLHMAAHKGHVKIVQLLVQQNLAAGQDCSPRDSDGMTPLMLAVINGHEDVAGVLLSKGARVAEADSQGRSSLHLAVEQMNESMLRLLLDHCQGLNAAVNAYDSNGRTPLHIAVGGGFESAVEMLLRFGANQGLKTPKRIK
ncbi:Ankyrin repeat-containing domain protein [Rhypophila decipiens]